MNFKKISLGLAATAAMSAGVALAEAPAQAASLADNPLTGGLTINLDGLVAGVTSTFIDLGAVDSLASPGTTVLPAAKFSLSSGSFTGITGGTIKDLPIQASFPVGGITDFVTVTNGLNTVRFNLLELVDEQLISNPAGPQGVYQTLVRGIFTSTGQGNDFTSDIYQVRLTRGGTNSGSLELTPVPVPTPALLPGLLGLGAAALRKRKGEGAEAEAEAVKA